MANVLGARMSTRHLIILAAVLVSACAANPKSVKSTSEVIDGAAASATPPAAPEPAAVVPPGCASDADCAEGERCAAGRCEAAPTTSSCSLVRVGFAFDSAQLDAGAMQLLRENADCISKRKATALLIEGHCDERGTTQYNVALGARRADAVKRYLAALGVTAKLDSVSFGKEIPIASGSGDAAWAQNRRAELRLPGDKRSDGQLVAGR